MTKYDTIGRGYRNYRSSDLRVAVALEGALAGCGTVLNVGAGVGSYEPAGDGLVALEPSQVMIDQRQAGLAPVVQGCAEQLPFASGQFDAVMGVLTLHHWADKALGLQEVLRVARKRVVLLSWLAQGERFWLFDYFPEIESIDLGIFPDLDWMQKVAGAHVRVNASVLPIPADCTDGFLCAYWRRPQAYLEAGVRGSISTFAVLEHVDERLLLLEQDLANGSWNKRNGDLMQRDNVDYGYRVVVLEKQ